ncbi:DUF3313 family protein [Caulobacter sp.]|uniref:DUF3313 family protein n=1 Tax=Caulobacter sp. TaxID=78 RepID=UPI002B487F9C|nr:DUF3313 family protein [Caulobacter sp.]HJV40051.1 DUF3313 family protein [Caulobacter sp.]
MAPFYETDRRAFPRLASGATGKAITLSTILLAAAGCQSVPAPRINDASRQAERGRTLGREGAPHSPRLADAITRVYIEPSALKIGADASLGWDDVTAVRLEVDHKICLALSRHFEIAVAPAADAGTVRTTIIHIEPTSQGRAEAPNLARPGAAFRAPTVLGGLTVYSELLTPDGQRATAVLWSQTIGGLAAMQAPSSPASDAMRLARSLGGAVDRAFSRGVRRARPTSASDPCAHLEPQPRNPESR